MSNSASMSWFVRHELSLAWRDWATMMSGGRALRNSAVVIGMLVFVLVLHGLAYAVSKPFFAADAQSDTMRLVLLTSAVLLTFTMMLSQAMEMVTRAFYARDDLDLILSSPAPSHDLFAVRISIMSLTTAMMSGLMVAPFINVAAYIDGPHWLAGYGVVLGISWLATACAVLTVLLLFKYIGAKRTRLVAQITAAIVGAAFLIGIQVVGIVSYGTMSRWSVMQSDFVVENAPALTSLFWLPAHALSGDISSLLVMLGAAGAVFAFATFNGATRFRQHVVAALGVPDNTVSQIPSGVTFKRRSTHHSVMRKEFQLLARDPWLISQTLMQLLYLVPPALMLWVSYGSKTGLSAIIAPVIVMAVGQLAGGLAWLAISGEDAPDLVATAPVSPRSMITAKINAVLAVAVVVATPFALAISFLSVWSAVVTLLGAIAAALCAIFIQMCFRAQAKRANFRRRQVASRTSTICEAFATLLCAGSVGLLAAGNWLALIPAVLAVLVLATAYRLRPQTPE